MAGELVEPAGPKTIDMTIRKGVEWSDGKQFSAEDVVFTFDLLQKFPAMDIKGALAARRPHRAGR